MSQFDEEMLLFKIQYARTLLVFKLICILNYQYCLGFMQAIQNMGLALCTMVAGMIVDSHGYIWLLLFFVFWLVVALICTIVIWLIDIYGNGYLNMNIAERDSFDAAKKFAEEEEARRQAILANPIRPKTAQQVRNR